MLSILPLFVCYRCGLELHTWSDAARAQRDGCPKCVGIQRALTEPLRGAGRTS